MGYNHAKTHLGVFWRVVMFGLLHRDPERYARLDIEKISHLDRCQFLKYGVLIANFTH